MNGNVIRTITIRGTSEGLDKLQADLAKVAAGHKDVTVAAEETNRSTLSLEQSLKRQALRLDEVARAQNNIARETKIADAALREGLIDQQRHAELLNLANQRYAVAGQATQKFTQQTGLARHELINLGRQAQDVGVSLASGQSPLMVLMQQGSQIADVFISSGKSVGQFFNQAIGWAANFAKTPAGIVTGIAAIGAAAVYAASQFVGASKTVEEALKEQNRLLKEGKALVDARTSAEARAQLQPKELTQFEITRSLLDIERKLSKEREDAERRVSRPTQVPGEMGVAPTAVTAVKEFASAFDALNTARAAGMSGMKEFIAELGKIGEMRPDLADSVENMIKLARTGVDLDQARYQLKAISDALKGIATDAQMAAAGLGSIAQHTLNKRMFDEAQDATERQAKAVLQMAQAYPGMSIEVAKQLSALQGQLEVAQAVGVAAQMEAQHRATVNQLLLEGKTLTEAIAIADAQQAIAQAQITSAHQLRMEGLADQLNIAQQITGIGQINAEYEAKINELLRQGLSLSQAIAEATMQREIALAQVNAQADRTLLNLQNEYELIKATSAEEKGRIRARQEYDKLVASGVDESRAGRIAAQMQANARATEEVAGHTREAADYTADAADNTKSWSVQMDEANDAINRVTNSTRQFVGQTYIALSQWGSVADEIGKTLDLLEGSQFRAGGYESTYDPLNVARSKEFAERYGGSAEPVKNILGHIIGYKAQPTLDLTKAITEMKDATKENTAATQAMTDVLSPYYSSDPRRTHLGFRSYAGGGIMTPYGDLPLKQYQGGGVATSPQVAVYGEGSTPEAYVPVPSGRIPVEIRQPANSNQRPINVTINVAGNADANTVAALKSTAFQQAQSMRRALG